jgi:signal peptidase I
MFFRWFYSSTVREACAMRKHVERLLCAQRDILAPAAIGAVTLALNQLRDTIAAGENIGKIRIKMDELDFAANKWIKPYPNAMWRENVEVLLVAVAVAMAIRTFFLQPFKIPTGSMQPTLFGVTAKNYLPHDGQPGDPNFNVLTGWERIKEWFAGISYVHVVAQADGTIDSISPMTHFLIFNIRQTLTIGGVEHVMWFPPDYGEAPAGLDPLVYRAGLHPHTEFERGQTYHKGDEVVKLRVQAGDHLFVDRFMYNFRKPQRGEIIVFATAGVPENRRAAVGMPSDQFYIKRLVGLGGETLSLAQDYQVTGVPQARGETVPVGHLVVNGQPLSAATPHFENLYSFPGVPRGTKTIPYQDNQYYGHALIMALEPGRDFQLPANHLFVMGDNTMNSSDSRFWGDFPGTSVIGKSFFVYWPITRRFGWGNQ